MKRRRLAGHLKLSNLCWIYDNNRITIEGSTALAFTEDVATRFIGYGWNVTRVGDANDLEMLERAFQTFHNSHDRPTLIIVDSHIAYGAPTKEGTSAAHGEPLGEEEIRLTKRRYGWPEDAKFLMCWKEVYDHFKNGIGKRGKSLSEAWFAKIEEYRKKYPELADHLYKMQHRQLPDGWDKDLPTFPADAKGLATRESSGKVLNAIAKNMPWLMGGSADLAPSTKTRLTFEECWRFSRRQLQRAKFALWCQGTCHGCGLKRHGLNQGPRVWLAISDLQRLYASHASAERSHGNSNHLHLYARFHWRRRRWTHASADRAFGLDASHSGLYRVASG